MAIKVKTGQAFVSKGVSHSSAYCRKPEIRFIPAKKIAIIVMPIYADQASSVDENNAIGQIKHSFSGADFDTYFDDAVIKVAGTSLERQAYLALMAAQVYTGAVDENNQPVQADLIDKVIWESDE